MTEAILYGSPLTLSPRNKRTIDLQTQQKKKTLNLNAEGMGNEGLKYLLTKSIEHVTEIKLWKNKLTWPGIELINQVEWQNLKSLYLNGNQIGNKGCYYLSRGNWQSLQVLSLYCNQIDVYGCSYLAKKNWRSLKELSLENNKIVSFNELNKMKAQNLEVLQLDLNPVTDAGYMSLLKAELPKARQVNLINNFSRLKKNRVKDYVKQKYAALPSISFDNERQLFH